MVEKPDLRRYQPSCNLAHELVNKLSIIVGCCDLAREELPENSDCLLRLQTISRVAKSMAEDLNQHQCELEVLAREAKQRKKDLRNRELPQLLGM